jgi:hypothetical protein
MFQSLLVRGRKRELRPPTIARRDGSNPGSWSALDPLGAQNTENDFERRERMNYGEGQLIYTSRNFIHLECSSCIPDRSRLRLVIARLTSLDQS